MPEQQNSQPFKLSDLSPHCQKCKLCTKARTELADAIQQESEVPALQAEIAKLKTLLGEAKKNLNEAWHQDLRGRIKEALQ